MKDLCKDVEYRFGLARGFLEEAEQDYALKRWRSCVSHAILVTENSALGVLMLFGVSALTHKPGMHLSQLITEGTISEGVVNLIKEILPELDNYDSQVKMLVKYGDESEFRLPWQLFDEQKGNAAIDAARKCMRVSSEIAELVK
jgi:HEPN domain-containing protein